MTYKYITQETIDSGGKNIKSPEEFAEARVYNIEAVKNYNRRKKVHTAFGIWIIVQYVVLFFMVVAMLSGMGHVDEELSTKTLYFRLAIGIIGYFAYLILVTWFVFIKHCRERLVLALVSMPAVLISPVFALFPVGNYIAGRYYQKTEDELSKELGYPSFARLNVIAVNSDADNLSELTYDSIREKINRDHPHDGTFL